MKILLVEDEAHIRLPIKLCLEAAGHQVIEAEDGLTAVEQAITTKPDLILLDLILPRLNGYLVCEALREEETTKEIPIIVISARAQASDIQKALDLGAASYLVKPFSPQELRDSIKLVQEEKGVML